MRLDALHPKDKGSGGGSWKGTYRLIEKLSLLSPSKDLSVLLFVAEKNTSSSFVYTLFPFASSVAYYFNAAIEKTLHLVLLDPRIKAHQFSFNIFNVIPFFSTSRLNAPFLYLHWAGNGFISLFSLRSKLVRYRSVIIKLADFWWVTGGCHYVGDCDGYISRQCRDCPLVLPWAKFLPHYI